MLSLWDIHRPASVIFQSNRIWLWISNPPISLNWTSNWIWSEYEMQIGYPTRYEMIYFILNWVWNWISNCIWNAVFHLAKIIWNVQFAFHIHLISNWISYNWIWNNAFHIQLDIWNRICNLIRKWHFQQAARLFLRKKWFYDRDSLERKKMQLDVGNEPYLSQQ